MKVAYCGICGSGTVVCFHTALPELIVVDLNEFLDGPSIIPTTPHPITKEKIPITLGHEFSGVIEEVGGDVTDIQVGQRVAIQPIIYDGTCGACRDGLINCCDNNGFVGISGRFSAISLGKS